MTKVADFRSLSVEEMTDKVTVLRKELMQYRFQLKTGKLERQSVIQNAKRDIARLLTLIQQKKSEVPS